MHPLIFCINLSLKQVKEYKYSDIMLSDKCLLKETPKQANKALFSLMKQLLNL